MNLFFSERILGLLQGTQFRLSHRPQFPSSMLTYKNVNLVITCILSVYVVKMVITSPEIFHSLLFSDCNIAETLPLSRK